MPEDLDMRCDGCGQGMKIKRTDDFNQRPPQFCPICGTKTLRRMKNVLGTADAACFKGVEQLAGLLHANWALFDKRDNPSAVLPDRFIDYLKETLEG